MNTGLVAGAPVEFWSNVLPSATDSLDLIEEVVRTRLGVAVAEPDHFLRNHAPRCREGGSLPVETITEISLNLACPQ